MSYTHDQVTQSLRYAALSRYVANPDRLPPDQLAAWLWDQAFATGNQESEHLEVHSGQYGDTCPWCAAQHHRETVTEPMHGTCKHCRQAITWRPGAKYVLEADGGSSYCRSAWRNGPHEVLIAAPGDQAS
jgi:hypothetical protein